MTFVIARKGRFEVRCTEHRRGSTPRSRTLATFRVLDSEVLDHAEARAGHPLDREALTAKAVAAGARVAPDAAATARHAHELIAAARRTGTAMLPPAMRAALEHLVSGSAHPIDGPAGWIGASARERADALHDLLGTVDRLPPPRRQAPLDRRLVTA